MFPVLLLRRKPGFPVLCHSTAEKIGLRKNIPLPS